MVIYTIGHSTRPLDEFLRILAAHDVRLLADVRTVPRSRKNPQYNRDSLPDQLATSGIDYVHLADLGGLRRPRPDSPNTGWRNESFRGYADYMQTAEFDAALEQLIALAEARRACIMCAEAVPWRCHRSLIADALSVGGVSVQHLMGEQQARLHTLTPFARVDGQTLSYPSP